MIEIEVKVKNDFESDYITVRITKEELIQLACNKVKGMYPEGYYPIITANEIGKIEILY